MKKDKPINNKVLALFANNDSNSSNELEMLSIDSLIPFHNHPFKLYEDERLSDMVESVCANGVIVPIIVRHAQSIGYYEILSGHNRTNAAKIAGLTEIPAIVKSDLTEIEAELIVTETNLMQRSFADLKYSERALALKAHLEAIKSSKGGQGRRLDLLDEIEKLSNPNRDPDNPTCSQVGNKLKSIDETGEKYGLSKNSVARHIRLTHLIKPLLDRVDAEEISFLAGVELSYLSTATQEVLESVLFNNSYPVSLKQARQLRELAGESALSETDIEDFLSDKTPSTQQQFQSVKLDRLTYSRFFPPKTPQVEIATTIEKALELYYATHNEQNKEVE